MFHLFWKTVLWSSFSAEIVTGGLIGITESVGLSLPQETLTGYANAILFSLSSPNVTINEALSFLPKDVLLTGSLLFLTNKENFPQLWENFSNAVKRTSLIEWIEVSLKLLPEYNYLIITSASMASGKKNLFSSEINCFSFWNICWNTGILFYSYFIVIRRTGPASDQ